MFILVSHAQTWCFVHASFRQLHILVYVFWLASKISHASLVCLDYWATHTDRKRYFGIYILSCVKLKFIFKLSCRLYFFLCYTWDQVKNKALAHFFWLDALHALNKFIGAHGTDLSVGGLIVEWRNLTTGKMVIGGTQIHVLTDIIAIATSALNHCTT